MAKQTMLVIKQGKLNTQELTKMFETQNMGGIASFAGIVRSDGGVEALSFDIDSALLQNWLDTQKKLFQSEIFMAHSVGDVYVGEVSFFCILAHKHRKCIEELHTFVQNFKQDAPIWKYDVIEGKKIYAKDRSNPLPHSGLLS